MSFLKTWRRNRRRTAEPKYQAVDVVIVSTATSEDGTITETRAEAKCVRPGDSIAYVWSAVAKNGHTVLVEESVRNPVELAALDRLRKVVRKQADTAAGRRLLDLDVITALEVCDRARRGRDATRPVETAL